ncbi:hypothetical protein BDEG_26630 [Batrachochytrium dendrobatidis JEL423]|uniref:DUF1746 domain-containing protein n=1 Tax=Batrachochytrium dendrobatidis (strain JEL423) TaxID=403673 RepID=A0A177WSZ0_BATDL|nr:hypothetical protein BDEG_26630 [Batrachochytrium dendrobatidis JEL423]
MPIELVLTIHYLMLQFQSPFMHSKSASVSINYVLVVNGLFLFGHFSTPTGPSVIIDFFGPVKNTTRLFLIFNDLLLTCLQLLRTVILYSVKSSTRASRQLFTITPALPRARRRSNRQRRSAETPTTPSVSETVSLPLHVGHVMTEEPRESLNVAESSPSGSYNNPQDIPLNAYPSIPIEELSTVFTMDFDVPLIAKRIYQESGQSLRRRLRPATTSELGISLAPSSSPRSALGFDGFRAALNWRMMRLNSRLRAQRRANESPPHSPTGHDPLGGSSSNSSELPGLNRGQTTHRATQSPLTRHDSLTESWAMPFTSDDTDEEDLHSRPSSSNLDSTQSSTPHTLENSRRLPI